MTPAFKVQYEETKETLIQTCALYRLDANILTYRAGAVSVFIAVSVLMSGQVNMSKITTSDYLSYFGIWLLIFAGAEIFRRTMGKKLARTAAYGDGDEAYIKRHPNRTNPLKISMEFFDDHFDNKTQTQSVSYHFGDVRKLLEDKDAFGIVIRSSLGPRGLYAFPRNAMDETEYEALKAHLIKNCPKVSKVTQL